MNAQMIQTMRDYFRTQPIEKAWVFGSFARGEETSDSDIDIIVTFDRKNRVIGLLEHIRMANAIEDLLGRKVDLVEEGTLLPFALETAERDKMLIYERKN